MTTKATNLAELARHGINVPRGFHLDSSHYREAIEPIRGTLTAAVVRRVGVSEIFDGLPLPERTMTTLGDKLSRFPASTVFAVRSSGDIMFRGQRILEDGREISLAGQFESFLNVPREELSSAVTQCWASLFNERSLDVFGADGSYLSESSMTVLIQEMIPATASAVVMTVDPLREGNLGGIEVTLGPCEAIVSGAVTPDEISFYREDGAIAERRIGAKEFAIEYGRFARGSDNRRRRPLAQALREKLAVSERVLDNIIDVARRVENIFNWPQDIELVIDAYANVTVVQARSITCLPSRFISFGPSKRLLT
jgi:phosphoenolpyruvate synthase/pyruvate phosphate dikinase